MWLEIKSIRSQPGPGLASLDSGEREAIILAEERHADLLLIDDQLGRREARQRGLVTTGTLGVLLTAGSNKLIDAEHSFLRLKNETSFRLSKELDEYYLARVREKRD